MSALHAVRVGVATSWTSPDTPNELDAAVLGPDHAARLDAVRPRDAHGQALVTTAVEVGDEHAGDLPFVARHSKTIHRVDIVARPRVMLHAPLADTFVVEEPLDDTFVVEEPLDDDRQATLVSAGRLPDAVRG